MTQEDIIKLAREAGLYEDGKFFVLEHGELTHFAALVAAAERNRTWTQKHWTEYERSIAAAEREACARMAEEWLGPTKDRELHIAAAIRARGNK
jgi:hypothetical protein